MKPNQFLRKSAIVATSAIALAVSAIGPAHAADTWLVASFGSMRHIDSGDYFYVCDDRADGHAVTGGVQVYNRTLLRWEEGPTWVLVDGGDAGCSGKGQYDVEEGIKYRMKSCLGDGGADGPCAYKEFYE